MKLKYYLRGLGIGIFITTIILSISLSGRKESLTDEEIIERAKALGMVEQEENSQEDAKNIEDEKAVEDSKDIQTESDEAQNTNETENKDDTENNQETVKAESETESKVNKEESAEETAAEPQETVKMVQVDIQGGQGSDGVAQVLFNAQVVDDAAAFNSFLIENKYDEHLQVGTFSIPKGATYEDVAKILTTK